MTASASTTQATDGKTPPFSVGKNSGVMPIMRADILIASLFLNTLSLALPMVLLQVYDRIIPNVALQTLTLLIFGLVVVLIIDVLLRTARSYLSGWVGAKYEHEMGCQSVEKLLRADLQELEKVSSGVHLDRLSSIDSVRDFYSSQAGLALVDLPFVLLFLGLLGYIGGALLVVPVLLLVVLGAFSFFIGVRLKDAIENDTLWEDRRYSFIIEILGGIHSIKSMAMENLMGRRYEKLMENCSRASYEVIFLNGISQSIGTIFSQITMVAVASVGSILVINGEITMGALAASTLLAGRTVQPLLRALSIWTQFQHIQIANQKIQAIDNTSAERPDDTHDIGRVERVEMKNVSFKYGKDGKEILQDVNLTLNHGETIGIRGGNGSGKSTLLWSLMGGLKPTSGEILINGQSPQAFSTDSLRKRIAYLPQRPIMFRGTILENLTMFRGDEHIDAALQVAEMLDLNKILARMPDGYETLIGDGAQSEIPTGIAQRITIARSLAHKPDLVLFDEANSGLDTKSDNDLQFLMERLKGTCTIVLVSYRPSLLRLADRQFDLKDGCLIPQDNSASSNQQGGRS
ncbi:peptidase domain-containing ABC transporter [Paremcibacter congregatus]|nr:ABC transporter transmembrane domain-containing protein [Paremcibacter congregatus]